MSASAQAVESLLHCELEARRAGVRAELANTTPERRVNAAQARVARSAEQLAAALAQIDAVDATTKAAAGDTVPITHSSQPGGDRLASTAAASAGSAALEAAPSADGRDVHTASRSAATVHLESLRALSTAAREPLRAALRLLEEHLPEGVGSARSQLSDASLDRVGASDAALDECMTSLEAILVSARAVAGAAYGEADALDSCSVDLGRAAQLVVQYLDDDARRMGAAAGMEDVIVRLASQLQQIEAQANADAHLFFSSDDHAAAPTDPAAEWTRRSAVSPLL